MESLTSEELYEFLDDANKHTYAADGEHSLPSKQDSTDLIFTKNGLTYHDTYFGSKRFIGEEIVYKEDKALWGMNYYGYISDPTLSTEEVYNFLKKALLQTVENDLRPVRGPAYFSDGDWEYINHVSEQKEVFLGEECIHFKKRIVYTCMYHGGEIEYV